MARRFAVRKEGGVILNRRRGGDTQYLHQGYGSPDGAEANSRFESCPIHWQAPPKGKAC